MDNEKLLMEERLRIGKRINQIRKEKGISAQKLAEMIGSYRQNVKTIETGKYSTGLDNLNKIAHALEMKIDFIEKY
jgi:transcriptional regulator with XRE-family HTH domain